VLLVGHLDTVPGHVPLRRAGGRLYGRGAVDAQGPLAALVVAAARSSDFPGRLMVVGVVEEETPRSGGATHLARTLSPPDAVIVAEPSGWSNVIIGYKGRLDIVYRIRRPASHPTKPEEKAAESAAAFWAEIAADCGTGHGHDRFDRLGATLHAISGDMEMADLAVAFRTPVGHDTERLLARLRARARGGDVEVVHQVDGVLADRRNPVARALRAGIRRLGGEPRTKLKTATSDMNTLAEAWSVPMATYGPGDSRLDHAANEHIEIDDYLAGVDVLTAALSELGELAGRPAEGRELP
jgi:[amino group carrier protein]-lysine/ornithine hydrolase